MAAEDDPSAFTDEEEFLAIAASALSCPSTLSINYVAFNIIEQAIRRNYISVIQKIIQICPTIITAKNTQRETMLHIAARSGTREMVAAIISTGAIRSTAKVDGGDMFTLELAAKSRNVGVILELRHLYRGVDSHSPLWRNPLCVALQVGDPQCIEAPYSINPDIISLKRKSGRTAIFDALSMHRSREIIETLCRLDQDAIDIADVSGATPLHECRREEICILQRYGTESHFVATKTGATPVQASERTRSNKFRCVSIRTLYFSRSITEILFFTLNSRAIDSASRRF